MKYGIDVCSYQGSINWAKVKKDGCSFAVLKCIKKDLSSEAAFLRNVAGCAAQKIPVSVYTYVYENTISGAARRAEAAVKSCKAAGLKKCVIWWDVEERSVFKPANRGSTTASIIAARKVIEAAGFGFGVYCDIDFYKGYLNANDIGGRWWIASYGKNPVTSFGSKPAGTRPVISGELCGWQYCSRGRVAGISGSVDLNVAYDDCFAEVTIAPTQTTGNPYPAPAVTVCSNATAAKLNLQRWIQQGQPVKAVQWELTRLGYTIGSVDGICGPKTTAAVTEFQSGAGLIADGACGPKTWDALKAAKEKAVAKAPEKPKTTGYRRRVAEQAKVVYPLCVGKVHSGANVGKVNSLESLKAHKALSCNRMASITMQQAGLLDKGVVVSHTKKRSGKKSIDDAVSNWRRLKHCKVYWVNKRFQDLPDKWKKAGIVYIQNSNACISAGNGKIWSCNGAKGHRYTGRSDYLKTDGYPFTSRILVVVVPDE